MNLRERIRTRLNLVFQEVFDDDTFQIHDTLTSDDVEEWDSIMHITLVIATEQEFGLRLNAAQLGKLDNVGAMVDLLIEKGIV